MPPFFKKLLYPSYFFLLRVCRELGILKKPTITICISSTKKYAAKTIPDLYKSLVNAGFTETDIYVVEGGHDSDSKQDNKENYFFAANNSFDLTALIFLSTMDIKTDYWFLLHDTCIVGKNFKTFIYNIPHYFPEVIPIRDFPSMNIGAYHSNFLARKKKVLNDMANFDNSQNGLLKAKTKAVEQEDVLFKQKDIKKKIWVYNPWRLKRDNNYILPGNTMPGYYDTERIVEYFPQADLYKFKANFKEFQANKINL